MPGVYMCSESSSRKKKELMITTLSKQQETLSKCKLFKKCRKQAQVL